MTVHNFYKPLLAAALLVSGSAWASEAPTPEALAGTCTACHGANGSSVGIMPNIAGTAPDYFIDAMNEYKSGERPSTVMGRIAKGYNAEEITKMAKAFSRHPSVPQKQAFDAAKAAKGAGLHKEYCEKCHEDNGRDNEEGPVLAGQSLLYLTYSMEDFKAGARKAPKKMAGKVKRMVENHGGSSVGAVLHFYASQQ